MISPGDFIKIDMPDSNWMKVHVIEDSHVWVSNGLIDLIGVPIINIVEHRTRDEHNAKTLYNRE